jgi:16S rRNA A1518/A1519 N6-dimethyltransferase RsmA/KsgA/DIM1 with predicted DNA glycosylase/AP lyase activity
MIKNLSSDYEKCTLQKIFIELWFKETVRAEELSLENFVELIKKLA